MEHSYNEYENIMRNYPLTVMTKTWRPQFPGPMPGKSYTKVLIPDKIREVVVNSPRLKALLDTVSGFFIFTFYSMIFPYFSSL